MNSKLKLVPLLIAAGWLAVTGTAHAQLNIPGADGSDGELATPPGSATQFTQTIDLSQAVTGNWDDNNTANVGKGVYDPEKWAVVFKYSSVNIRTNTVIKFKNHPSRAPVVWLISGDVTIAGEINLNGNAPDVLRPAEPGPGGFRGGVSTGSGLPKGPGFGPGGGNPYYNGLPGYGPGSYFGYAITSGEGVATTYGNSQIVPLVGGSGGGGGPPGTGDDVYGGAGGGAILIATRQTALITGRVVAVTGPRPGTGWDGSGGAIRLIANTIAGRGELNVAGSPNSNATGGAGRIRIETPSYAGNLNVFPPTLIVTPDSPPLIWPRPDAPEARVVSVGGKNSPIDPDANLESGADITMQDDQPVDILVETKNLDVTAQVKIRITPRNGVAQLVPASFSSGTRAQATWIATTKVPQGFAAIQVRAVGP